jgi:hypothetical protein
MSDMGRDTRTGQAPHPTHPPGPVKRKFSAVYAGNTYTHCQIALFDKLKKAVYRLMQSFQ